MQVHMEFPYYTSLDSNIRHLLVGSADSALRIFLGKLETCSEPVTPSL